MFQYLLQYGKLFSCHPITNLNDVKNDIERNVVYSPQNIAFNVMSLPNPSAPFDTQEALTNINNLSTNIPQGSNLTSEDVLFALTRASLPDLSDQEEFQGFPLSDLPKSPRSFDSTQGAVGYTPYEHLQYNNYNIIDIDQVISTIDTQPQNTQRPSTSYINTGTFPGSVRTAG